MNLISSYTEFIVTIGTELLIKNVFFCLLFYFREGFYYLLFIYKKKLIISQFNLISIK